MMKKLSTWMMLAAMSGFLLSCVATAGCVSRKLDPDTPWKLKPQESFGLMLVKIEMTPKRCENIKNPKKKCSLKKLELKKKIATSVGSSIVVYKNFSKSQTFILTAAHVCGTEPTDEFVYITGNNEYKVTITQKVLNIEIVDYTGTKRTAEVHSLDKPNDLCIVYTQNLWGKPFKVSASNPVVGQKVFNVASPHKIWSPGMVLMLDGYYSGQAVNGFHHYTVPARPGSSGSPIFDRHGRIVGMVQRAVTGFENLALSTSTQAIREIMNSIPRDKPNTYNIEHINRMR